MTTTAPTSTIPVARPSFGIEEENAVLEVLRSGPADQTPMELAGPVNSVVFVNVAENPPTTRTLAFGISVAVCA